MYDTNKIVNKILGSPIRKDGKSKNNKNQHKEKCIYCGKETTEYELHRNGPVCHECLEEPDYML